MIRNFTSAVVILLISLQAIAQNPDFEARRAAYIGMALAGSDPDQVCLQAYSGVPVNQAHLDQLILTLPTRSTVDFDIVKLVRIMFLSNGEYDSQILPGLSVLPFWVNYGDTLRGYWSENHMCMWMSSNWLLHERNGFAADTNLRDRLVHYLNLKNTYGFYEYFSSVYGPFCLSGLLNLADFSQDVEIKTLATQAAQRLLSDFLLITNTKGTYFPSAGRNYFGKYTKPYGQNHNNLIHLLTGFGAVPTGPSHAGAFLATSTLFVDDVMASWQPNVDLVRHIGHTLEEGQVINQDLGHVDRIMFQWSSGAYFHPLVVEETAQLLIDSNMWQHVDFSQLAIFSSYPASAFPAIVTDLNMMSMSSVICGQDVAIYKHGAVTLASTQDFWKGKAGYQQSPCVANVGTTAVLTASGEVFADWEDRSSDNQNQHLPYVEQKHNVALLMYREEPKPEILGYVHPEVALFFQDTAYDEITEQGNWLLGRQDDGYVAVRRACMESISGVRTCGEPTGQSWVIVVGDADLYGTFEAFSTLVGQSQFTEAWYTDPNTGELVYEAGIQFDTTTINYAWGRTLPDGVLETTLPNGHLSIFPNPTSGTVRLDIQGSNPSTPLRLTGLTVTDMLGRTVVNFKPYTLNLELDVSQLSVGLYTVSAVVQDGTVLRERLVVTR